MLAIFENIIMVSLYNYNRGKITYTLLTQYTSCIATNVHTHVTDMIVGLTYLLLMSCDIVRNSSQALTSGGTAASNPPICCSTDVNCSIII